MRCFICQKKPAIPESNGGFLCADCNAPKHVHEWETFKFSEKSKVVYATCKSCGEQQMGEE